MENINSTFADLRASVRACELTCEDIIDQIEMNGLRVLNPEFRNAMETFKQSADLSAHDRVRRFHGHISILSLEETRQDAEILAQMQLKADAELAQNMLEDLQDHDNFLKDVKGHWIIKPECNMKQERIILSKGTKRPNSFAYGPSPAGTRPGIRWSIRCSGGQRVG